MVQKEKIAKLLEKIGTYQLVDVDSKIEKRRSQIFNFSLVIESFILISNSIRHYLNGQEKSSFILLFAMCFLVFLFFTNLIKRELKYIIFISLGIVVTYVFINYVDNAKDIIQVYLAVLLSTSLFLSGKKFYIMFFLVIGTYYFTFFNLNYQEFFNPLGALTFIFLTLMMRLFVKDAEENEKLIVKHVEELKEVDVQKTRLFSNISHEIRTPLTLILGANEQLQEVKENKKLSKVISDNSNRMLELVNQILELSKISANQRIVCLSKVDLFVFLSSILQSFEILSKQKNIKFSYSFEKINQPIFIDEDAFSKIIVNLLSNAFKFSNQNGKVDLIIQLKNNKLKINVIDEGIGISENELPYIFNQYYHSNVGLEASSGIGLALVKELVALLEGEISVQSKINFGSNFSIELPCYMEEFKNPSIQLKSNSNNIILNEQLSIIKKLNEIEAFDEVNNNQEIILIVEDNDELRTFISEIISTQFKVIEAKDGVEGLELAKQFIPDIILSDVMMPNMDGFEMLNCLKNDIITSHIPVLMLTAKVDEKDVLTGLQLKADDYIVKPFSKQELLLRLANKIDYRNKIRESYQKNAIENCSKKTIIEDKFLLKLNQIIKANLSDTNFGSDELSKEIGLSSSQLFRKLKSITNISASTYIRNIRLEEAKLLLINSTVNISEIAYDCGFSSLTYFGKCFKEYTGLTPKEYSKKQNKHD